MRFPRKPKFWNSHSERIFLKLEKLNLRQNYEVLHTESKKEIENENRNRQKKNLKKMGIFKEKIFTNWLIVIFIKNIVKLFFKKNLLNFNKYSLKKKVSTSISLSDLILINQSLDLSSYFAFVIWIATLWWA